MANKSRLESPILTDPHDINDTSVESPRDPNQAKLAKPISITNDSNPDNSANYLSDSVNSSKCEDDGDSTPDDAEIETNYLEDTPSQHRQPSNTLTSSPDEDDDDDDEDQKQYTPNVRERGNSALYYRLNISDTQTTKRPRRRRNAVTITVDTPSNNTPNRPSRSGTITTSTSSYGSTSNSSDTNDTTSSRSRSVPPSWNSISSADTASIDSSAVPPSWNSLDGQSRRNSVLSGIPEQDEDDDDDDGKYPALTQSNLDIFDATPVWLLMLTGWNKETPSDAESDGDLSNFDQHSVFEEIVHRFINDGDDPTQYNQVTTRNRAATTNTTSSHSTDTPASWNSISSNGRSSRSNSAQSVYTNASLNSYGSNDSISRMINNGGRSSRRGSIQSVSTDASLNSYGSNDSIAAVIQNMNMLPPLLQPINEDQETKTNQINDDAIATITGPSRPGTAKSNTSFDFGSRARSSSDGSEDSIGAVVIDSDDDDNMEDID